MKEIRQIRRDPLSLLMLIAFGPGGLIPLLDKGKTNVALFVIGLAFLVIGAQIAKKNRTPR